MSPKSGMTLIELLLAMVVAVLAVSVVLAVYHTVTLTVTGQEARRETDEAASLALEQMARDLTCTFVSPEDSHCFFALEPAGEKETPALSFCTTIPPNERDLRWTRLEKVIYRAGEKEKDTWSLLRISKPIVGPGMFSGTTTNVIAQGITKIQITAYGEKEWEKEWPASSSAPEAVRIALSTKAGTRHVEAVIPAGIIITSSIQRLSRK